MKQTKIKKIARAAGVLSLVLFLVTLSWAPSSGFEQQQMRVIEMTGYLPYYKELHFYPESLDAVTPLDKGVSMIGTAQLDWKFNGEQPWFLRVWIDDEALVAENAGIKGEFRLLIWCPNFGNNVFVSGDALHEKLDMPVPPLVEETLKASEKSEANWLRVPFASEMRENQIWLVASEPVKNYQPNRFDWRMIMGVDNSDMRIVRGNPQRWENDWNKAGDMTIETPFTFALAVDWGLYNTSRPSIDLPLVFQFVAGPKAEPVYEKVFPVTLRVSQSMNMFGGN